MDKFLDRRSVLLNQGSGYEPEVDVALEKMATPFEEDNAISLNNFVISVKNGSGLDLGANNLHTMYDGVYRTMGPSSNILDYGVNLVDGRLQNLTATGTISFDSVKGCSMTSGWARFNCNLHSGTGVQFSQNDGTIMAVVTEIDPTTSEQWYWGSRSASSSSVGRFEYSYNRLSDRYAWTHFDTTNYNNTRPRIPGTVGLQRDNSLTSKILLPSGTFWELASTAGTWGAQQIDLGNYNNEGVRSRAMKDRSAAWLIGNGSVPVLNVRTSLNSYFGI
jgi:hypothetical protein